MPCYRPLRGYRAPFPNAKGKYPLFSIRPRDSELPAPGGAAAVDIPCGRCSGCLLERSRVWAVRCVHEASLYENNCFVTLTYSDGFLPSDRSLSKRHFQLFMKRMRKAYGSKIRFFACGEYGETWKRPHYHACIFNFDFPDKVLWKVRDGVPLYTSVALSGLWPYGFSSVGAVTFESAAYTARYVMKKVFGSDAKEHYSVMDPTTGEFFQLEPEFVLMSRRPGIGRDWYEKYRSDVFPSDLLVTRGVKMKPPRYYDNLYESDNPVGSYLIRIRRQYQAEQGSQDATMSRLKVRQQVVDAKICQLKRGLDYET
ncbi:replication associated protein [Microviridae sp.]|nr:replication associated protein [Microviridae sp.]